ncbi:hypothetical protein BDZ89DRAFT_1114576 [Hymenopellis radicata]|nr:hypothetical protein BDZ89DRAFT_1114576 [Hymenopellis radicata]
MSETIELSQITTDPQSSTVENFNFIAKDELGLDGLEYHLGLSRGEIVRYRDLPIMCTSLRADMVELMKTRSWALLPSTRILHQILDLYKYNHNPSTATDQRKLFTDVLPEDVYEYELMPVYTPDRLQCTFPLKNTTNIRIVIFPVSGRPSTHALSFVPSGDIDANPLVLNYAPNPISKNPSLSALLSEIFVTATSCVNISWLHGTWFDFRERGVAVARHDPKPPARESPVSEDEEIHTDEERDLEDPRLVLTRYKLLKYMATHNQRSSGTTAVPPTTVPSADVPGKRKRTISPSPAPSESVDEQSGKRRSKRLMASKKPPSQDATIVNDLATPPPTVRKSSRKRSR